MIKEGNGVKRIKGALALIIAVCLLLSACGSQTQGRFRVLRSFGVQEFRIGFRNDDYLRYFMEAQLKVMAAEGITGAISRNWFSEDAATFPSDAAAMDAIEVIPYRNVIIGANPDAFPMSYLNEDGTFSGFDIDVVRTVCQRLGWDCSFQPIKAENAYVELSSGNVDVAWGGLALDGSATNFTVLAPYMANELVLVTRSDSGIRSVRGLKGKTLAIDVDQKYMDVLAQDQKLMDSLGEIRRMTGGMQSCFEAMDSGGADATIAYSVALIHYAR